MKRLLFCLKKEISEHYGSSQNERMKLFRNLLPIFFFGILIFASCNEPSLIGSELVEGEQGDVIFKDTSLTITTEEGDSLIAYSPAIANYSNYLFGDFKDPVFGTTTVGLFIRPVGPGFYPGFGSAQELDSAVLVLPFDTLNAYGDFSEPIAFEIYEVIEKVSNEEVYFTDTVFMTEAMPFISESFMPNLTDSLSVTIANDEEKEQTIKIIPHLRIPLGADFADRLIKTDSLVYESDSLFSEAFKGFYIKPVSPTGSMLSFNLGISNLAGVDMFYHPTDSSFIRFHLPVDRLIVPNIVQDRAASFVQDALDSPEARDSLLFLQGLKGLRAKIELPDLSSLGKIIINRAEIEFTIENVSGDEPSIYQPINQVLLSTYLPSDTTAKILINDVIVAGNSLENLSRWFGGDVQTQTSTGKQTYTVSIASHLQDVLNGDRENILYLETFDRAQKISRVVLKNSGAKSNPAKLKLYYTEFTN